MPIYNTRKRERHRGGGAGISRAAKTLESGAKAVSRRLPSINFTRIEPNIRGRIENAATIPNVSVNVARSPAMNAVANAANARSGRNTGRSSRGNPMPAHGVLGHIAMALGPRLLFDVGSMVGRRLFATSRKSRAKASGPTPVDMDNIARENEAYEQMLEDIYKEKLQNPAEEAKVEVQASEIDPTKLANDTAESAKETLQRSNELGTVLNAMPKRGSRNDKLKDAEFDRLIGRGDSEWFPLFNPDIPSSIPEGENATRLLEYIKHCTPYGLSMQVLQRRLAISPSNATHMAEFARMQGIAVPLQSSQNGFRNLATNGLSLILRNANFTDVMNILRILTPARLLSFKMGMMNVFNTNPANAMSIFELFVVQIVGRISSLSVSEPQIVAAVIDPLIDNMRRNPLNALADFTAALERLGDREVNGRLTSIFGEARREGTFRLRIFWNLLRAGAGGIVLFLGSYMNVSDVPSLMDAIRDIAEGPAAALAEAAFNSIVSRLPDGIAAVVAPLRLDAPMEPVPVSNHIGQVLSGWSTYYYELLMVLLNYDPTRSRNQREFRSLISGLKVAIGTFIINETVYYVRRYLRKKFSRRGPLNNGRPHNNRNNNRNNNRSNNRNNNRNNRN